MSELENIPARFATPHAALVALGNLSRMLEITRGCYAQAEAVRMNLEQLAAKLTADRKLALQAIDAMTETAPSTCGLDVSPYVEDTGAGMQTEVCELERQAAAIVAQCGGLL